MCLKTSKISSTVSPSHMQNHHVNLSHVLISYHKNQWKASCILNLTCLGYHITKIKKKSSCKPLTCLGYHITKIKKKHHINLSCLGYHNGPIFRLLKKRLPKESKTPRQESHRVVPQGDSDSCSLEDVGHPKHPKHPPNVDGKNPVFFERLKTPSNLRHFEKMCMVTLWSLICMVNVW